LFWKKRRLDIEDGAMTGGKWNHAGKRLKKGEHRKESPFSKKKNVK